MAWTEGELHHLDAAEELEIAGVRADGALRPWTPIWLVVVDGELYVRTWYRRDTGWFGRAVSSGRARVRVPGVEVDVHVTDLGSGSADLHRDVDAAYLSKYQRYGSSAVRPMVADAAVAATLRLDPARDIAS